MSEETTVSQGVTEATQGPAVTETTAAAVPTDWRSSIPEDLREETCFKDHKGLDSVLKSYVHLDRLRGRSIRIPTNDAGQEELSEFYNKLKDVPGVVVSQGEDREVVYQQLGKPVSPDKYEVEIPEILGWDHAEQDRLKQLAFDMNLSSAAAQMWVDERAKEAADYIQQAEAERNQAEEALRQKWGQEYDNLIAAKDVALQHLSSKNKADVDALVNSDLGNNLVLIQLLAEKGQSLLENKSVQGAGVTQFGMTPEEADQRISELLNDKNFMEARRNVNHPRHNEVFDRLESLYQIRGGKPS